MIPALISLNIKLREYVGALTGLSSEMDELANGENARGTEEVLAMHRKLRDLDKKLDNYLEHAAESLYILKTSVKIEEHVKAVLGLQHGVEENADSRFIYRRFESSDEISDMVNKAVKNPIVIELNEKIKALREEVARKMGLKSEMDAGSNF